MRIIQGKQIINGLELCTALVVSTAHITKKDAELLGRLDEDGHSKEIWAFSGRYGWFVFVDEGLDGVIHEFSKSFCRLLEFAKSKGCWWVRLDCDGPEIKGLRKFSW